MGQTHLTMKTTTRFVNRMCKWIPYWLYFSNQIWQDTFFNGHWPKYSFSGTLVACFTTWALGS